MIAELPLYHSKETMWKRTMLIRRQMLLWRNRFCLATMWLCHIQYWKNRNWLSRNQHYQ